MLDPRRRPTTAIVLLIMTLAGCASASPKATAAAKCPAGASFMGCAAGGTGPSSATAPVGATFGAPAPGARVFPDVSSWQGHPDWAAAKGHITGGVAKAFEYRQDPDFAYNVAALKRLGLPWAAYDFVRSCNAAGFIAALRSVGGPTSMPPVLDEEVPAANGCTYTLAHQIFTAFHRWPIEYTSPGTEPSGAGAENLALWIADFGPSFPCLWTCHPVAWQFASPPFVYYRIPGLGYGDVSIDYGMTKLVVKPKPTPRQLAAWTRARNASARQYDRRGCATLAQRIRWFGARQNTRSRRRALRFSRRSYRNRSCAVFKSRRDRFERLLHS